ncbi:unnamed protein product [Rotaria sordida]|uniref:F-box domain-containing protein n=1 Tax=Rotaria sordida TaxID=392033 RepID=A0A819MNZ7_9BILA|nr:unnamed protein product [Rotaria sordida]CAF3982694.1 unnamed protein product [Rotaria sordida]
MVNKLEILPNEIFLHIFSYLSWDDILISLWSINERINSLICSIFSMNKYGIIFNKPGLSYKKCSSILFPLIFNSSSLCSNIKSMYFDGIYSIPFDFIYEKFFYHNDKQRIYFPNLKSLYITKCLLSQPILQILSTLIKYQLNELLLTFHGDINEIFDHTGDEVSNTSIEKDKERMFQQLLCQIFSDQCQLTSLKLNIKEIINSVDQCLKSHPSLPSKTVSDGLQSYCTTLRHLDIHLNNADFLEDIIERIPNVEQLSVDLKKLQRYWSPTDSELQSLILPNGNWFDKVPKLKCFTLKSCIYNDLEFTYLKWLLNNINHVTKLDIHLYNDDVWRKDQTIWKSIIDANFIRQYCLPDQIINLRDFQFYICIRYQLLISNIGKIKNSFRIHPFFIDHQWTNVECFYQQKGSYQHIFSSTLRKLQFFDALMDHPILVEWLPAHVKIYLRPSIYLFFEQFNKLCPNASCITFISGCSPEYLERLMSLSTLFQTQQLNLNNIQFRNVTKLRLGHMYNRRFPHLENFRDEYKTLAKTYAHIISMCTQLRYLSVSKFEWLLYIIEYAFDDLRKDALSAVQYAEFGITSCNFGYNESVHVGKHLVSVLGTFMPHLKTLCLWRLDDFPWTSIRPDIPSRRYGILILRWQNTSQTSESILQHVRVFEEDLCELVEQLKGLVYLNIYGKTSYKKVELYRLMVQNRFPNSHNDIQTSRFRLWI